MATIKRSKKSEGVSQRREDETREKLAPGVTIATTKGEDGGPNKKIRTERKKAPAPSKTANQTRKELNLAPVPTKLNVKHGMVY